MFAEKRASSKRTMRHRFRHHLEMQYLHTLWKMRNVSESHDQVVDCIDEVTQSVADLLRLRYSPTEFDATGNPGRSDRQDDGGLARFAPELPATNSPRWTSPQRGSEGRPGVRKYLVVVHPEALYETQCVEHPPRLVFGGDIAHTRAVRGDNLPHRHESLSRP